MSNGFSTNISVGIDAFQSLQDEWLALDKRANNHPFSSFHWCLYQAQLHATQGRNAIVITVYQDARCLAILPLVEHRLSRKLPFKCLKHLCTAFSDYQEFIAEPSVSSNMLFELCLSALSESAFARYALVFAYPSAELRELCARSQRYLQELLSFNHWRHSFYNRLSPPLKSKVTREARRRRKKLLAQSNSQILIDTEFDESLINWILDRNALRFGANQLTNSENRQSVMRLLRNYKSSLHLSAVLIDGEPATAHLGFLRGSTLQYYLLAADDKFREYSVGIVLLHEIISAHSNVENIDFLRGDEDYKKDWANTVQIENGIVCLPQSTNAITAWLTRLYTKRNQ